MIRFSARYLVMMRSVASSVILIALCPGITRSTEPSNIPLDIGSRLELFVDDWIIDRMESLRREQQTPIEAGKVLDFDQPWEGHWCNYVHIFKDGNKWRMYYRGARAQFEFGQAGSSNICLAVMLDEAYGVHHRSWSAGFSQQTVTVAPLSPLLPLVDAREISSAVIKLAFRHSPGL